MTKRLQVLLEEEELREIRRTARRQRMTVAEWVRQALRRARRKSGDRSSPKLAAIREAVRMRTPRLIEQMLRRDRARLSRAAGAAGVIFIDSNIPMYLVGAAHPFQGAAATTESCVRQGERLVTDVEVLQEILHRYAAIRRL
jgi:predicted nucleic acid-binding protein